MNIWFPFENVVLLETDERRYLLVHASSDGLELVAFALAILFRLEVRYRSHHVTDDQDEGKCTHS